MKRNGTVSAWAGHTSSGAATTDLLPGVVSVETTTTSRTTLGALGVAMLRKIAGAATLIAICNPGNGSVAIAGTSADLNLTAFNSAVGQPDTSIDAQAGDTPSRAWVDSAQISGATDFGLAVGYDPKLPKFTVQQILDSIFALVGDVDMPVAVMVRYTQTYQTGALEVWKSDGTDPTKADGWKSALSSVTIGAGKEILGVEFDEVVETTTAAASFLE